VTPSVRTPFRKLPADVRRQYFDQARMSVYVETEPVDPEKEARIPILARMLYAKEEIPSG
jgi:hypothetical protein